MPTICHNILANGSGQIVADAPHLSPDSTRELAIKLCDPADAIGADGFVAIQEHSRERCVVTPYTPDGNEPALCVNGGIAAAIFHHQIYGQPNVQIGMSGRFYDVTLEAGSTFMEVGFAGIPIAFHGSRRFQKASADYSVNVALPQLETGMTGSFCDVLTPQLIIERSIIEDEALNRRGRRLNGNTDAFPSGINISEYRTVSDDTLFVRTFERGGAGLSASCSSAMVAVVATLCEIGKVRPEAAISAYSLNGRCGVRISRASEPAAYSGMIRARGAIGSVWSVSRTHHDLECHLVYEDGGAAASMETMAARELSDLNTRQFFNLGSDCEGH
jgi:diaminopimelate epimerase